MLLCCARPYEWNLGDRDIVPASKQMLIQVVPRLTPGHCGVSDQAVLLAHELQTRFGIDTAFAVLNSNERCSLPFAVTYCYASRLLERSLDLTHGRPGAMLLHVSGYGYSADGAPAVLAEALQKVRASAQFRTAAYFHETYANGPPWTSAFWHSRRQRMAVRRIVAQCGRIVTNTGSQADWLTRESRRMDGPRAEVMPVFSPGGETDAPVAFAQRDAALVVFGLAATRRMAYERLADCGDLMSALEIEEIHDVGPDCGHPAAVNGVRVKRIGRLAAEELQGVISRARYGFVVTPWSCLGKSSVFAACCAQGTVPVLPQPFPAEVDGLRDGVHVVTPQTVETAREVGWDACSNAAWSWYFAHRLHVHAERYANWMSETA